jgi:hypothetical protein
MKTINKVISREKMMQKLQKSYPSMMLRLTEDFDGCKGGIWTSGEDAPEDRTGMKIFDYYTQDYKEKNYIFGVRVHLHEFLSRNGWYAEWHDAGTMMLWQG